MTIDSAAWPRVRLGWQGHVPKISAGQTTEQIFRLAWSSSGATIDEMLQLRRDDGKPYDDRRRVLVKLLKEISNAYEVKLTIIGDIYRFISEVPEGSASNKKSSTLSANLYLPTEEDIKTASRLAPLGERVSIDAILDQIEINVTKAGHSLKPKWRMITEENIKMWVKK